MNVRGVTDPVLFRERVSPLLLEDEARHNLLLGLITTLAERPEIYPRFHLWLVEERDEPLAAAVITLPYNLTVSKPRHGSAIDALAQAVFDEGVRLPGVTAATPEATQLVSAWGQVSGQKARLEMAQRIYRLETVRPAATVPGSIRRAGPNDRHLVVSWVLEFLREVSPRDAPEEVRDAERRIGLRLRGEGAGYFFWEEEDGTPACMVGYGGFTPHGVRIGPVYTPPALRGRGYASALTAGVSAWLLAQGRRFCFLYTDLANPTSNRIYQRIGYDPVCDSEQYRFEPSVD